MQVYLLTLVLCAKRANNGPKAQLQHEPVAFRTFRSFLIVNYEEKARGFQAFAFKRMQIYFTSRDSNGSSPFGPDVFGVLFDLWHGPGYPPLTPSLSGSGRVLLFVVFHIQLS